MPSFRFSEVKLNLVLTMAAKGCIKGIEGKHEVIRIQLKADYYAIAECLIAGCVLMNLDKDNS